MKERVKGQGLRRSKIEKRYAFTLIELLVVVAIIALLLAILMPSLRKARGVARRVGCQSNLKQLAVAWNLYLDDNDGRFYQEQNANLNYGGWQGMRAQDLGEEPRDRPLNPYLQLPAILETEDGPEIFCCPADRGGVPGYAARMKAYRYLGTSYQTNIMLIGYYQILVLPDQFQTLHEEINKRLMNLTRSRVYNHSRLLLMGDYGWINQWKPISLPDEDLKELAEWHGRADCHNLAFLDSHVKFLDIRKGIYVADEYSVLPFKELYGLARQAQGE
jgi:prepilin-type N-terminal cleavage/methylation domain-containing protein